MNPFTKLMSACILFAIISIAGCSSESETTTTKPEPKPMPQDTPKATMVKMIESINAADETSFMACFDDQAVDQKMAEFMYSLSVNSLALKTEIINTYGAAAWDEFSFNEENGIGFTMDLFLEEDIERWLEDNNIKAEIQGDKATFTGTSDAINEMEMIKKDDNWYVFVGDNQGGMGMGEYNMLEKMMETFGSVTTEVRSLIGKEGQTPETLKTKFDDLFEKAMMSMMTDMQGQIPSP